MNAKLVTQAAMLAAGLLLHTAVRQAWALKAAARRHAQVASQTPRFEHDPADGQARVLVLGDSTALGVGAAQPCESLPGLLAAEYPGVAVVNRSVAGARVSNVLASVLAEPAPARRFDLVLLMVGGNDVLRATPLSKLAADAEALLLALRRIGRHTVWLSSANVGLAPLFIAPFSWWLSSRTRLAYRLLNACAQRHGADFVNFYRGRLHDPFSRECDIYFAPDRLHPSSESYSYCYEVAKREARIGECLALRKRAVVARVAHARGRVAMQASRPRASAAQL